MGNIITIVGGGSTFTPGIVTSIALRQQELEVDEVRLFDIDEERQRKVGVVVDWILKDLKCFPFIRPLPFYCRLHA